MTQAIKNNITCEECGSTILIDRNSGSEVCRNCGLIFRSNIFFDNPSFFDVLYNNPTVNSFPTSNTTKDPNLFRQINLKNIQDFYFQNKFRRLIQLQKQSNFDNGKNLNFIRGLHNIKTICANLELPNQIEEEAASFFRKFQKLNKTQGRSIIKICLCCVYLAAKSRNNQYIIDELSSRFDSITKKELIKLSNFIAEQINFSLTNNDPSLYLTQIIQKGGFPKDLLGESLGIIQKIRNLNTFQGKSPQTIAAAAIYIVCKKNKLKITQKAISLAARISRKSLSLRIKEIKSFLTCS
ncbi:MAG: transcription initiation factor IIB family protein [Candidatus Lokiarchaeota archaeon]|nr:transcription initiation factor IIB family protein [Candidatus Lokiarchaeota archaeon]